MAPAKNIKSGFPGRQSRRVRRHQHGSETLISVQEFLKNRTVVSTKMKWAQVFKRMTMHKKPVQISWVTLIASVFLLPQSVQGQNDVTETSVLNAYVKSIGDVDALKSIGMFRIKSTLTTESPLGELEIEITRVQSGALYVETREIPEVGIIRTGYDGEVYWTIDPFQGARIYEGEELEWIKESDSNLLPDLSWTEDFDGEIVLDGTREVEGRQAHKLIFKPKQGLSKVRFFDKDTGAMIKTTVTEVRPDGLERVTELVSSDYRMHQGFSVAHKQIALTPQGTTSWVIDTIESNLELPESAFSLPEEIQRLKADK